MKLWVPSLALLSELWIRCCLQLQHMSKMLLGYSISVAVAQTGSCSSTSAPSPGTSICRCSHKKKNKQTNKTTQLMQTDTIPLKRDRFMYKKTFIDLLIHGGKKRSVRLTIAYQPSASPAFPTLHCDLLTR